NVTIDRERAGVLGVTTADLSRSLTPATSSSRFTQPVYWAGANGVAYQVQVEVPQHQMASLEDIANVPVSGAPGQSTRVRDIAQVTAGSVIGEYDRYNMTRLVSVTANIEGASLGAAAAAVRDALHSVGNPPAKVSVTLRGEVQPMDELLA